MNSTEASKSKTRRNSNLKQSTLSFFKRPPPLTPIQNLKREHVDEETPTNPLPDPKKVRRGLFPPESFSGLGTDPEAPIPSRNENTSVDASLEFPPRAFPSSSNPSEISKYHIVTPRNLPDSIPRDRRSEYIQIIATRQIDPWNFDEKLEELDLRSPLLSTDFSSDYVLLSSLLRTVSQALKKNGVKAIDNVHFPDVHIDSGEQLLQVLQGFLGQDDTDFEARKFNVAAIHIRIDMPMDIAIREKLEDFAKLFVARNVEKVVVHASSVHLNTFFREIKEILDSNSSVCEMQLLTLEESPIAQHSTPSDQQYTLPFSSVVQQSQGSSCDERTGSMILPRTEGEGESHHMLTHDLKISSSHEYPNHGLDLAEQLELKRFHESGINGRNIRIAFLTSGISCHHLAFQGAIDEMQSFVPDENSDLTIDELGYGTMCASVAGGRGFDYPVSANARKPELQCLKFPPGVAPGAKLMILKVTSAASTQAVPASVIEALEYIKYIHGKGKQVNIVCVPMGSTSYNREIQNRISALQCLGIIIVCAAGNATRDGIAFPARCGGTLCVGACDANGARYASTPIGQQLDFLAPGLNVWCAGSSTAGLWEVSSATGNSCACAAVAGVVAVVLQYIRDIEETRDLFEKIDTHVIKELLKTASTHQTHHSEKDGFGSLDLTRFFSTSRQEIRQKILKIISC